MATAALPPTRFATGTALVGMSRQVGAALGVAALVAIVGTPAPEEAVATFGHAWLFVAGVMGAVAVAMLPLVFMGGLIGYGAYIVAYFNIFLAVFNMIPVMPLDGSKVLKWNVGVYAAALAGMGALFAYIWFFLETTI